MKFVYVSGRHCLDFAGTMKHRRTSREELMTEPWCLSEWAIQAGLVDAEIAVTDDDLAAALELREAIYRVFNARLERNPYQAADVEVINDHASKPRLTPRLDADGSSSRDGNAAQLLATLAADTLELLAGSDIDNVKKCVHPDCTRMYLDSSRAKNRHWCGMGTCGNKMKVQAFRARQRVAAT